MTEIDKINTETIVSRDLLKAKARSGGLLAFTLYTKLDYQTNWHHKKLCKYLNLFIKGHIKRLMVFMPPRHGKSELVSRRLPALLHGLYPNAELMAATYNSELAGDMTTDIQRIMDRKEYHELFPRSRITPEGTLSKYARNATEHELLPIVNDGIPIYFNGKYRAQGIGGSFSGRGANWILIDDPIKNRDDADSKTYRENVWKFYTSTLRTRLEGEGSILLTMCMTGDTFVLMADGTKNPIRDLKVGDEIATYDNGKISTSTIKNWKCQGPDSVFRIKTSSGIFVKANERHPFLVCRNGALEWVRLRDLRVNDKMMRAGVSGSVNLVPHLDVENRQSVRAIVSPTIIKLDGHQGLDLHPLIQNHGEQQNFAIDTELTNKSTTQCSPIKAEIAQSVEPPPLSESTCQSIGREYSALTTTIIQGKFADSFAMNAILSSSTVTPKKSCSELLNTYEFTLDEIVEISEAGIEDVFDIQVNRTENFIANGLVSHNTRWHEDDLAGRLLKLAKSDPEADQWIVVKFPAIKDDVDNPDDPRQISDALWPDKFNEQWLMGARKAGSRDWSALYQQKPTSEDGNIFKAGWFRYYKVVPQRFDQIIQSWDFAVKDKTGSDYNVGTVWGRLGAHKYLLHMERGRWSFPAACQKVIDVSRMFPSGYKKLIEGKANGPAVKQTLDRQVSGIVEVEPRGDKIARANAVSPEVESGNVWLPEPQIAPWIHDYVSEMCEFPNSTHDDIVDSTTMALDELRKANTLYMPTAGHGSGTIF